MILPIQTGLSNQILRDISQPITHISSDIRKLARDMKATIGPKNGIGLAAPQVGVNLRMVLIYIPSQYYETTGYDECALDQKYLILNPKIVSTSDDIVSIEEGCLSLPDYFAEVLRPSSIEFSGINEYGESIGGKADGIFARVLQHEIDHLDGILFADKALPIQKKDPNKLYI